METGTAIIPVTLYVLIDASFSFDTVNLDSPWYISRGHKLCFRRWCIDKLGVFHANQIYMCLDPYLNKGWGYPSVKYFTDRSKAVLLLWIFYVFSVLCLLCLCARLFICGLWSPAAKGLTSWLSFVVSYCEFVTFTLVSWVRCGTWLYCFLIFASLLTSK